MAKKRRPQGPQLPAEAPASQYLTSQQRQQYLEAQISATFSGPLPHPDILRRYNDAVPDAAERIIAMVERQSAHRIQLEKRVVEADISRANWGLVAGLVVALAFGGGSFAAILAGYPTAGLGLGGGTIVSLVGTFVYGTESRKRERQRRAEMFIPGPR